MAAANGGSQSAVVEKIQNEATEADSDPAAPPSAPPALPSVTVSSGGFVAIAKRFAQHFPLLLGLYLAGYFRMSLVWIVGAAGLTAAREQWRKERDYRMNAARLANFVDEEDIIKARVVDLPSWVFFPDFERAEWINKILKSVWPNVSKYVENLIVVSIEPSIREALNAYKLTGFKFEKMQLGAIPLRVGGVKAYDRNVARNEIIMDLDVCYAGNCDFRFSVKGIKAGIKDFQIKGLLRCIMKPLVDSSPFVGGLQLFFLNNPDVDFNLLGMADVLDMPGLADIMRRIISDQIGAIMVLPNKISVQLSDTVKVETLKMHEPAGVLRVRVIEAKDLMRMDVGMLGKGKSDPYAVINVGSQEFRTKTIMNTVNPKWNFNCEFKIIERRGQNMSINLMDEDDVGKTDDFLGRASVDINSIAKAGKKDMWAKLEDASTGSIHLEMTWFNLSSDPLRLKDHTAETISIGLSSAVVSVFVDSAKMLPRAARSSSQPEAYAILSVGSKTVQTTVQQRSCDPIWEQAFSFLVCNPESDDLHIKVMDQKTNSEIGRCKIVLVSLLAERDMSISHQPLALKNSGPESKIILSVQLRVMVQGAEEEATSQHAPLAPKPSNATPSATPVAKVAPVSIPEPVKPKAPLQPTPSVAPSLDKPKDKAVVAPSQKPAVSQPDVPAAVTKPAPSHVEEAIEEVESVTIERPEVSERNIESMLSSAMAPLAAPSGLNLPAEVALTPSLRRRNVGSDVNCGRVQLTLRYSTNRQKFVVVVHQAENLPGGDDQDPPDPYVKLYLLPDRKESGKRKTEAIKDSVNPHYDESFEFPVSLSELPSRNLEVSVLSKQKQSFFHKIPLLGQVKIDLSVFNWQQPTTEWFDLRPGTEKYVAN